MSSKNDNLKIYLLALISFLIGTSQFSVVGMLDKIAASTGVSVSTAGQLVTLFALGNAIGTPLVIVATSRLNQRKQLLIALSFIILGIISTLSLSGFGFLMISRVILGIGTGVFVVTAYAVAAKLAPMGRQGRAMSTVAMGYSSSLVFGVPFGRMVASTYDWKTIFWIIGILGILGMFAVRRMIPSLPGDESVPLSQRLAHLKNPRVAITLGITFFIFIGYSVINTYITPYLTAELPLHMESKISIILLAMGVASLIGSRAGGLLADKFGTTRTLRASLIVQIIVMLLVAIFTGSPIITIPLLMIWEMSLWTFGPTQNLKLVSLAPQASGIVLSLNVSFIQLGFAAGAGIGGITIGALSVADIPWISVAAAVVGACLSLISYRIRR